MGSRLPVLTLLPALLLAGRAAPAAERPNLVVLLTDDQRWDALGAAGNPVIETPSLDRLAGEGVRFSNAFVTTSICSISRASILTGQYAMRHEILDFKTPLSPEQLEASYLGRLKAAGYTLGFVGKYGVSRLPEGYLDFDRTFPGWGDYALEFGERQRHLTGLLGDQALEFLEKAPRDRPFCLSVSFKAPHAQDSNDLSEDPFPADPGLARLYEDAVVEPPAAARHEHFERLPRFLQDSMARYRWAIRFWGPDRYEESVKAYYRLVTGVDRVVGRLRSALGEQGLDDDTVIVFLSDNGFYLGEYGLAGKWFPHDVSMRIPLIVYDPRLGGPGRGRVRDEMVLNIDVAPTLLDLAGLTPGEEMQGRSLAPLVRGETPAWRDAFYYEHHFDNDEIPQSEAVRTERWKYVRWVEEEPVVEQLFDLESDPEELEDLAASPDHRATLERLRREWGEWRERAR